MQRLLTPLLLGLTLALASSCGSSEHTGSATFSVTVPQGLETPIARVTVLATADDFVSPPLNLTQTGGVWGGTLNNIPAGSLRSFRAQAFDTTDTVLFEGAVSGITISANQTTQVSLLLQQVPRSPPRQDEPPVIDSLVASTTTVAQGGAVSLSVTARDANPGDTLTYAWTSTAGTFSSTSATATTWTAPSSATGIQTLTVTVTDPTGLSSSASVAILVSAPQGESRGSARLTIGFNLSPTLNPLALSPTRVAVGEATRVSATASDPDGDTVSYAWSASCAGTWSSPSSSAATFTPSALPAAACNNCRLTVSVADREGLKTTGSVALCVSNAPRINHFPPRIANYSQSTTTVTAGDTATLEVLAQDPENSTLTFAWSANEGSFGVLTSSATTHRVAWTPPACGIAGASLALTSTVTNAFNLTASKSFNVTVQPACASGWAAKGNMLGPRFGHTATPLSNGRVLVVGGYDVVGNSLSPLQTAEVYDPATASWSATGALILPRGDHTATLLSDGKVLVVGGLPGYYSSQFTELYDPVKGTWSGKNPLATAREDYTVTLLPNGKVLVTGGRTYDNNALASVELFDPATGNWSATGAMSQARSGHTATLLSNGKVLVAGGDDARTAAELYDPATGTWSATGSLITMRYDHSATRLSDGKVLVAGGYKSGSSDRGPALAAELYDPATGTWSSAGDMTTRYGSPSAVLMVNGKVLVVGGDPTGEATDVYDPATRTWSSAGNMATRRSGAALSPLPNGRVLICGGVEYNGNLRLTEHYTP